MPWVGKKLLANTPFLILCCLALGLLAYYLVRVNQADVSNLFTVLLSRPDTHAEEWNQWVRRYGGVFSMISPPARIGIQERGERATGVLIEKTSAGFHAKTVVSLASAHPGLVFNVDPVGKEKFFKGLGSRPEGDIWAMMKDNLYGDHMKIWYNPDLQTLKAGGYLKLMRDIDTKPDQLDWKGVRQLLGEPDY